MSKTDLDSLLSTDRIPTYEEALASSSTSPFADQPPIITNSTSSIRQERSRSIEEVVGNHIIPCFATHVSLLCSHMTVILIPAETISTKTTLTAKNVVSPSIPSHRTVASVIQLSSDESHASFWTQQSVVQALDVMLKRHLSGSYALAAQPAPQPRDEKSRFQSIPPLPRLPPLPPLPPVPRLPPLPRLPLIPPIPRPPPLKVQRSSSTQLPPRPAKQSWLKRTFVLPGEDHDPTGETGKWNLGWRSSETANEETPQQSHWTTVPPDRKEKLQADEVAVSTQLRDVSFRTESEMGLLETTTIKCIWIEIEVGE